jgi:hypothetical protein
VFCATVEVCACPPTRCYRSRVGGSRRISRRCRPLSAVRRSLTVCPPIIFYDVSANRCAVEDGEELGYMEWAADVVKEAGATWYAINVSPQPLPL